MYGNEEGFRPRNFAPINIGDEVDVKVEAVGDKGDGIAKIKGFVLFIPNTKEGDEVKVKITKVLRRVGFAEVVGQSAAQPQEEPKQEEPKQEEPKQEKPKPEEVPEDTEDFGEDLEESK